MRPGGEEEGSLGGNGEGGGNSVMRSSGDDEGCGVGGSGGVGGDGAKELLVGEAKWYSGSVEFAVVMGFLPALEVLHEGLCSGILMRCCSRPLCEKPSKCTDSPARR